MTDAQVASPAEPMAPVTAAPEDDRKHERRDVDAIVDFVSDTNFYGGLTENLSVGGIFVATFTHAPIGEHVRIRFDLPDDDGKVEAEAEVRWLRLYNPDTPDTMPGMGLRFTQISPRDVERIGEFVQAREPLFYEE